MKACRSNLTAATRRAVGALFVAACLGAPSSMATPLPNPPFQGGFVPPDAATAAVEEQVATFFTKTDVRALAGCTLGLMKGLFVANQRGDASAAALADATYRACRFKEGQTWVRYRDTLLSAGGLPACLGTAGELDVMHGTLTSDFGITMTNLFCDGALTSYGPHVPPDAATYSHTTKVAQILFRFADRTARCKIKYADRVAAAGGDPVKLTTAASLDFHGPDRT